MDEVHIARHLEVDVAQALHFAENFQVVRGDIGQGGEGECRTAAGDATPGTAVFVVDQDGLESGFGQIAEQSRAGHAATGHEGPHAADLHIGALGIGNQLDLAGRVGDVADLHEVGHRAARREIARNLDAIGAQGLFGARQTARTAARAHAQTGNVLEFLGGDAGTAFEQGKQVAQTHVFAVADVREVVVEFGRGHLERLGVVFLDDEAVRFEQGLVAVAGIDLFGFHDRHVGLVGFADEAFDGAFSHFLAVVIDQEDF